MSVLTSADGRGVNSYRANQADDRPIEMAVILQEMVEPVASGVAFSKHPVTGLNEIVVEAVAGQGEPYPSIDELAAKIEGLEEAEQTAIATQGYKALPPSLQRDFDDFLERFGHFGDSGSDFSLAAWRDIPDAVVKLAALRDPSSESRMGLEWDGVESRVPAPKRPLTRALHRRAAAFSRHRDLVSSTYTFGYGLFRDYFLEIGHRLTGRALIGDPEDVMFLSLDEVRATLRGDPVERPAAELVTQRRSEIEVAAELDLPDVIFGKAGAIVAESGGMLSHSSVVAREFGIPCVVSVHGALRIPDGAVVTVDGHNGVITLEGEE